MVHMLQFNGKQGGAFKGPPNLRCPRNGKWMNRLFMKADSTSIETTGCTFVRLGR